MTIAPAFKTVEGEARYFEAYDAVLRRLWPVPFEEIEVNNRFGTTHVVVSGPEHAPPLVLLHGFMFTLNMWAPYIGDVSTRHRVYAVDVMGQPSKSIPDEPIRDAAGFVEWLTDTLDGLHLGRVSLAGISFGGWISLGFTMAAPERVERLALLSPAASFLPLRKQFGVRAMLAGIIPTRRMMDSFMRWMGIEASTGDTTTSLLLDLMWLGGQQFRMPPETRRVMPGVFSDDELRGVSVPVLLLFGEGEVMYDAAEAVARARRLIPDLEAELVPGCRHDMSISRARLATARVMEFLDEG